MAKLLAEVAIKAQMADFQPHGSMTKTTEQPVVIQFDKAYTEVVNKSRKALVIKFHILFLTISRHTILSCIGYTHVWFFNLYRLIDIKNVQYEDQNVGNHNVFEIFAHSRKQHWVIMFYVYYLLTPLIILCFGKRLLRVMILLYECATLFDKYFKRT